jgi:hypothetical protein
MSYLVDIIWLEWVLLDEHAFSREEAGGRKMRGGTIRLAPLIYENRVESL